jgi:hypothetical protein
MLLLYAARKDDWEDIWFSICLVVRYESSIEVQDPCQSLIYVRFYPILYEDVLNLLELNEVLIGQI